MVMVTESTYDLHWSLACLGPTKSRLHPTARIIGRSSPSDTTMLCHPSFSEAV